MFVRIKITPDSPRRPVQLLEGVRNGGKVRQRIVRHIGVAMDEGELERPRQLGEYVKAKLEDERQPTLFAPEKISGQVIRRVVWRAHRVRARRGVLPLPAVPYYSPMFLLDNGQTKAQPLRCTRLSGGNVAGESLREKAGHHLHPESWASIREDGG